MAPEKAAEVLREILGDFWEELDQEDQEWFVTFFIGRMML